MPNDWKPGKQSREYVLPAFGYLMLSGTHTSSVLPAWGSGFEHAPGGAIDWEIVAPAWDEASIRYRLVRKLNKSVQYNCT